MLNINNGLYEDKNPSVRPYLWRHSQEKIPLIFRIKFSLNTKVVSPFLIHLFSPCRDAFAL